MPTHETTREITIEAPSVEEALAEVTQTIGPDAEIVSAEKVHRGGFKGFFAREMVQLIARASADASSGDGIAAVLERMTSSADAADTDFRTMLRRQMAAAPDLLEMPSRSDDSADSAAAVALGEEGPAPRPVGPLTAPATAAAPQPAAPPTPAVEPAPASAAGPGAPPWRLLEPEPGLPSGMGPVAWSTTALARLGLPAAIIDEVAGLDPRDDLGWINGIATAVAPYCGPLPDGDVVVAGPHADRLADALGLTMTSPPDMPPYAGSVAAVVHPTPQHRGWLEYVLGNRSLHLVIGEDAWRDLLVADPAVVSWVGEASVIDALYLCSTLGAKLGFGTVDGFVSGLVRAHPIDVALAIRRIAGRR